MFTEYKNGIQTDTTTPTGAAGLAINQNFIAIGDAFDTLAAHTATLAGLPTVYLALAGGIITGTLTVDGITSLDESNITTDNLGNLTVNFGLICDSVTADSGLVVGGTTQLDGGDIYTNGAGGLTASGDIESHSTIYADGGLNAGGTTALDSGGISNDGSGNLSVAGPLYVGADGLQIFESGGGVRVAATLSATGNISSSGTIGGTSCKLSAAQTTTKGAGSGASGNAVVSEPLTGTSYKKVVVYLNALKSPTAISYTYPTAFTHASAILGPMASYATASTTSVSITTAAAQTGFAILEGY